MGLSSHGPEGPQSPGTPQLRDRRRTGNPAPLVSPPDWTRVLGIRLPEGMGVTWCDRGRGVERSPGGPQPAVRRCTGCPTESFCNTPPWVPCSLSLLF